MEVSENNKEQQTSVKGSRSLVWFFAVFVIVLVLIIYYFSSIRADLRLLQEVNPIWLIVAIICQLLTYFISSIIYRTLLRPFSTANLPSVQDVMKASVIALLFNQTIPSAGISGNAFFFRFLDRYHYTRSQILSVILTELLIFYAAIELLIIVLLIACLIAFHSLYWINSVLMTGMIVYLLLAVGILFTSEKKHFSRLYANFLRMKVAKKVIARLLKDTSIAKDTSQTISLFSFLKQHKRIAWKVLVLQLLLFVTDSLTLYVLYLGMGHPVSAWIALLALVSTQIVSIIPFLPGGLILYEGSMSFFFVQAGSPVGMAIVITMVYRLLSFWFPIPAGTYLYRRWLKRSRSNEEGNFTGLSRI